MKIVNSLSVNILIVMIVGAAQPTTKTSGRDDTTSSSIKSRGVSPGKANLLSILFGSSTVFGRRCNCKCGIPNRGGRILGGTVLDPHELPWLAVVYIKALIPVTGSLLNDRYIVTAASPLAGYTPYDVKVTLGSHFACFPDTTSTNYSVSDIHLHPEYGQAYRTNDLALLKLNTVVLFDMNVLPVCLATPGVLYTGQVSTVASWINSWNMAEMEPTKLCEPKKVGLPILENSYCTGKVLASSGCIGVIGVQNVLCKADVGAGVYFRTHPGYYELVGILSDQQDCISQTSVAGQSSVGVSLFTRLATGLNWILKITNDACYCNKP